MQTATAPTPAARPFPRPSYPESSRTIQTADARTRELAEAMVRLNAEGEATRSALRREGFSDFELDTLSDAARSIADRMFVRQDAVETPRGPTDDELLTTATQAIPSIDAHRIAQKLYGAGMTHDHLARVWPKLMTRLAGALARSPIPNAPVAQ